MHSLRRTFFTYLCALLVLAAGSVNAQVATDTLQVASDETATDTLQVASDSTDADKPKPRRLFRAEEPLEITLAFDFKKVFKDKGDDRQYHPATISYTTPEADTLSLDIRVKTRGFYRRVHLNCDVPPLKLNFKKVKRKHTVFKKQDTIKLVTHCKNKSKVYEQYTLQEYLVYKTYNLLTDHSFKARLLKITYVDSQQKKDPITKYGFFIENEDDLAKRMGGRSLETGAVHPEATDKEEMTRLAVFQYMIGNTDWAVSNYHNIKLVLYDPMKPPIAIPYDFDWTGIISTKYAVPHSKLNLRSVRDRVFLGFCRDEATFAETFALFNAQREPTLAMWQDFPLVEEKRRKRAVSYLEDFYEIINDPGDIKHEFLRACRTL